MGESHTQFEPEHDPYERDLQDYITMEKREYHFHCSFQQNCADGKNWCEYPCEKWIDWHDKEIRADERKWVLNEINENFRCYNRVIIPIKWIDERMQPAREEPK